MDLDLPLFFLAIISAAALTVRSLRSRPIALDWLAVAGAVIATLALGGIFFRAWMGTAAFAVWFVLGWAPMLLSRAIQLAMERLRYDVAEKIAQRVCPSYHTLKGSSSSISNCQNLFGKVDGIFRWPDPSFVAFRAP